MKLKTGALGFPQQRVNIYCLLGSISWILCCQICQSEKIRYATEEDCDRHSLDAIYHEKYELVTRNIFADSKEFVSRVLDLVSDSLTTIMADLPDSDVSGNQEKKIHTQFKNIKGALASKMKKMQKNITSSWEDLIASNFDIMFDNGKSSLEDYLNKTIRTADSYSEARKALDAVMSSLVGFVKTTVRDGLLGIEAAAEDAINKKEEEEDKDNTTREEEVAAEDTNEEKDNRTKEVSGEDNNDEKVQKDKDDTLREKMVEIAKMIVPGFLGKLTVDVIEKKMDLKKPTGVKADARESVLDDIEFDILMVKNRIRAIVETDVLRDKGSTDLARRSIYTYWADAADNMYKVRLQSKKSGDSSDTGRLYYRNLWRDEQQIAETLLNLMEVYP